MTKFLLVALALLSGCAEAQTPNFRVEGFTADEIEVIQDSLDQWCEVSNGKYCEVIDQNASNVIRFDSNWSKANLGTTLLDGDTHTITIYNNKDTWDDWYGLLNSVVLHELGHHFRGDGHLAPMGNDVMSACGNMTTELTEDDVNGDLLKSNVCH